MERERANKEMKNIEINVHNYNEQNRNNMSEVIVIWDE